MNPGEVHYETSTRVENLRTGELIQKIVGDLSLPLFVGESLETDVTLPKLPDWTHQELEQIVPGLSRNQFVRLMAAIELGRRIDEAKRGCELPEKLGNTHDATRYCENKFSRLATDAVKEEFHILTLDTKNRVINSHLISVGTLDASLVHPREVFRPAIRDCAASIVCVHNHPSGDPAPSKEDLAVTKRLENAGKTLGIDVLDHIVVAKFGARSVREQR